VCQQASAYGLLLWYPKRWEFNTDSRAFGAVNQHSWLLEDVKPGYCTPWSAKHVKHACLVQQASKPARNGSHLSWTAQLASLEISRP
jgi:hypothetical protein